MRHEDATTLKECYQMGRGLDFCTGREMVIGKADNLSGEMLARLCRAWQADPQEVNAGIAYQRGIEAAAARMLAERGKA